jgi:hypothetical protein
MQGRRATEGAGRLKGYRTYIAAAAMGLTVLARQTGWLTPEQANMVYEALLAGGLAFLRSAVPEPPKTRKRKRTVTT